MTAGSEPCPICAQPAILSGDVPGYQRPERFGIRTCSACLTAYCEPRSVDPDIYEAIYRQIANVPGYERYFRYSREITRARDPLAYLAGKEDVYWAVAEHVARIDAGASILEVGSGLGYLTYALARRGFNATGVDISRQAVEQARARYGGNYRAGDVRELARDESERFDVVIMTELIEHIPDPLEFLAAARALLKPNGSIIVTTPNRSIYPDDALWHTELPPVHLWWFSEASLTRIAARLGMTLKFTDFRPFHRLHGYAPPRTNVERPAVLDEQGNVCQRPGTVVALLHRLGLYDTAVTAYARLGALKSAITGTDPIGTRSGQLCAAFRNG